LFEDERLGIFGDTFQQLDVSTIAGFNFSISVFSISAFTQRGSRFPSSADAVESYSRSFSADSRW
jgi:hypothetical protein